MKLTKSPPFRHFLLAEKPMLGIWLSYAPVETQDLAVILLS